MQLEHVNSEYSEKDAAVPGVVLVRNYSNNNENQDNGSNEMHTLADNNKI